MRRILFASLLVAACSRETPAPPQQTATSAPPPAPVAATQTTAKPASYEDAMTWFKTANAFHFVVDENGVHCEGELTRPRIGQESITVRANGHEWRASAGARGVTWTENGREVAAPALGRLWQRVTVAFDPQKVEGGAQRVADENGAAHYRFTNANTGEVHDVWVRDGRIERMTIGRNFAMTLKP